MPYVGNAYRYGRAATSSGLSNAARGAISSAAVANARTPLAAFTPLAAKGLGRFIPYLGWAMLAYDLYELYSAIRQYTSLTTVCKTGTGSLGPFNGALTCGANESSTVGAPVVGAVTTLWHFSERTTNPNFYTIKESYTAPSSSLGPARNAAKPIRRKPKPLPDEMPWLDPWDLPIANPAPDFNPLPYWVTPYRTTPFPNPDPSHVPSPRPAPRPGPLPAPSPRPRPGPSPAPGPAPAPNPGPIPPFDPPPYMPPEGDPDGDPGPVPNAPPPPKEPDPESDPAKRPRERKKRRPKERRARAPEPVIRTSLQVRQSNSFIHKPPPRHTTEAKLNRTGARLVWALANGVTEMKDFLEAMYKALPDRFKTKQKPGKGIGKNRTRSTPPVPQMFKDVTNFLRQTDLNPFDGFSPENNKFWSDALDNLIENQIEDYVFGKFGKAAGTASRASGRPVGYTAGPAL